MDETPFYLQRDLPIFQNRMYDSLEKAQSCPQGDILLVQHNTTGLVYNSAFNPELMIYDHSYQNEQAHSPLFLNHLNDAADIVDEYLGPAGLVEVGCGKATFLELLQARGSTITGYDPTYQGDNPHVKQEYFAFESDPPAKGLILRHVLEHVSDPVNFLQQLLDSNQGDGLIYIEVPCFEWILRTRTWFDIFYEHVNYFRLSDFYRIFKSVVHSGRIFGDQYFYVVADLGSLVNEREIASFDRIQMPPYFGPDLQPYLASNTRRPSAVWGAASKGVIYSLMRERAGDPVKVLIDINPDKQGRFVPGTGLEVFSPAEGLAGLETGSEICVMNANYAGEIRKITGSRFNLIGVTGEQL